MAKQTEKKVEKQVEFDREKADKICKDLPTTSAKIRALHRVQFTRSQIAHYLEIRYQHVRNVLVTPLKGDRGK